MEDTRIGRFFAVDPLFRDYPWYSPYQFAGNTPIEAKELEGLESWHTSGTDNQNERPFYINENGKGSHAGPLASQNATDLGYTHYGIMEEETHKASTLNTSTTYKNYMKDHEALRTQIYYRDGGTQNYDYTFQSIDKVTKKKVISTANICCGNATIGYGHLIHYGPTLPDNALSVSGAARYNYNLANMRTAEAPFLHGITVAQANSIFENDVITKGENPVARLLKVNVTQNQFDALVDFSFNAGSAGPIIRLVNQGKTSEAAEYLRTHNIFSSGHIGRRAHEASVFLTPGPFNLVLKPIGN